jgi:RNA polymerase sigma-54 factor
MSGPGLQQIQKQSQSLVLAPQLRHSLKILQVPALELRSVIQEELQNNPLLEDLGTEAPSLEAQFEDAEAPAERDETKELDFDQNFEILNQLDEDWREYFAQENASNQYTAEDAGRRQHFFDSVVGETSLQQHLMQQAEQSELSTLERRAIEFIVGSLDKNGFCPMPASDLALMSRLPLSVVQSALKALKNFDPPGIGCFDLQDCLLFQLEQRKREKSLAARIIRDHYKLLLRRRIPELARKTGESMTAVTAAIEEIATLNPKPAATFSEDTNRVVEPDVTVYKNDEGTEWLISLNNDHIPRLRLNNSYKEMLARGRMNPKDREYIVEKMRSGRFLINSIQQRQQTIERITREILKFQRDFFDHGVSQLRPLTMSQVADAVGVHETTVSRAISSKFIATPWGVYDFKFFFKPGYTRDDGESVSNTSIKEMIAHLVEEEDPSKPLSDQELARLLSEKNYTIARRTVAKYREEIGILPTNLRRRYH